MPKRCSCGREYDAAGWEALPHIGDQVDHDPDGTLAMCLELRNCPCGSTLCVDRLKDRAA